MNKKALFLSTSIPPFAESHTIRNVFFINALIDRGYDVIIIAGEEKKGDASLNSFLKKGARILRTDASFYSKVQSAVVALKLNSKVESFLRSLIAVSSSYLLWPDVWAGWNKKAVKVALSYFGKNSAPDLIISSSGSFSAHLAAEKLSNIYKAPWVADYGDPWYLNPLGPQSPWLKFLSWTVERKLLMKCSSLSFTTKETGDAYRAWLGGYCPLIEIIPCGYFGDTDAYARDKRQKFVVAYVGSAGAMTRNLGAFMKSLDDVVGRIGGDICGREIVFRIVGSSSPLFVRAARGCKNFKIEFTGWVSYPASLTEISDSDALLLVGNKSETQIPGKVYQYLYSKNPIIYWSQMEGADPTRKLLMDYCGVVDCGNRDSDRIRSLMDFFKNYEVNANLSAQRFEGMKRFSWPKLGAQFADLCDRTLVVRHSL